MLKVRNEGFHAVKHLYEVSGADHLGHFKVRHLEGRVAAVEERGLLRPVQVAKTLEPE